MAEGQPALIEDAVVQGDNAAGVYGVRLYIRGKPWVVDVDDILYFQDPESNPYSDEPVLRFAGRSSRGDMWAPILEKAWAKVKGSYSAAAGAYPVSTQRALVGAPSFYYEVSNNAYNEVDEIFPLLQAGEAAGRFMAAGTSGGAGADATTNGCGVANGHAYSILATFTLTDGEGAHDMVLLRNPWGLTYYSGDWNENDPRWTEGLVS